MDVDKAFNLACDLMCHHVSEEGLFVWTQDKKIMATAFREEECDILYLSKPFVKANDEETVLDVILHEIAHFHSWEEEEDHGPRWQTAFAKLGGSGSVTYDVSTFKWELHCPDCKNFLKGWYRRPKVTDASRYQCKHCDRIGLELKHNV